MSWPFSSGLTLSAAKLPPPPDPIPVHITAEAGITAAWDDDLRVEPLIEEDDLVAQGAPIFRLRRHPEIVVTAPMPARAAKISLGAGHRLTRMIFFREEGAGRHEFRLNAAKIDNDPVALRAALQGAGMWRSFRSRPFGGDPLPEEKPAAIMVMALDTRPGAPDPRLAISGRETELEHGLRALTRLTEGPVFFCQGRDVDNVYAHGISDRVRIVKSSLRHPWGLAGYQAHQRFPAAPDRRVWDIHAEDVVGIGAFLQTGLVPETRLVSITGSALREQHLVRCQPGADLRGLGHGLVKPGRHSILSGSALDGREARWLAQRDRQATVITGAVDSRGHHWFLSALQGASRPLPVIPTAAVDQAMGGALPAAALLRALSAGDTETAIRLGVLSFLPEDMALVDYVTCAEPRYAELLTVLLKRIKAEETA